MGFGDDLKKKAQGTANQVKDGAQNAADATQGAVNNTADAAAGAANAVKDAADNAAGQGGPGAPAPPDAGGHIKDAFDSGRHEAGNVYRRATEDGKITRHEKQNIESVDRDAQIAERQVKGDSGAEHLARARKTK